MKKKADISVNVVIIAVLALLVLIILAFIFSGKLKVFNTGAGACKGECVNQATAEAWTKGPTCSFSTSSYCENTYSDDRDYCCISVE